MPACAILPPVLLALLPAVAACTALPLRRLPPACSRLFAAAAAGMQIAAALFLLLLPALDIAAGSMLPIWLPTCGGVLLGTAPQLRRRTHTAGEDHAALARQLPPVLALGALTAALSCPDAANSPALLPAAAAAIGAQYLAENLSPQMSAAYAGFMHLFAAYLPAAAALLTACALSSLLPLLQVLLLSAGAGAMLCRAVAQTIPQLQHGYRDNLCTLCIGIGFALILLCYCLSR